MFAMLAWYGMVLLISGAAQVPNEPDFSGEWVLIEASGSNAEQATALIVRQTITRTTARGEPMTPWFSDLRVDRRFKRGVASETYKIGIFSGTVSGTPPGASSAQGEWTRVAVKWVGDSLAISTMASPQPPAEPGPYTEHEEVWSLDQNGRLLITTTDYSSGSRIASVKLVYERRVSSSPVGRGSTGACSREAHRRGITPFLVGRGVRTPTKIRNVNPAYPKLPPGTTVKALVWLGEVLLDETGAVSGVWTIRDLRFEPPFPAFTRAILDALLWTFEPATAHGRTVPVCMTVTVLVHFE